jgi:lipoprotein-releasing system permease protein
LYRWFIALKYLRSRFITFAALLIVASAVALLIVILSVMEGFRTDIKARIRGTSADLRVESRDYIGLRDPRGAEEKVAAVPGVRAVSPFVETKVMYRSNDDSQSEPLDFQGVDLAREARVGGIESYLVAARDRAAKNERGGWNSFLEADQVLGCISRQPVTPEGILSPEWLDRDLWESSGRPRPEGPAWPVLVGWETLNPMSSFGFMPGRTIEAVSFSPITNRLRSGRFFVAGVFLSRDYAYDRQTLVAPRLADTVAFLELGDVNDPSSGRFSSSGLRVAAAAGEELDAVRDRIAAAIRDVPFARVRTWQEEKASLLRAVSIEKSVVGIILGVLILFAGFMIFIVLAVQVVEKTRDLGILQSLGSTSWGIAGIYFRIGAGVCLSGTLLGTVLGVAFSLSVNTIQRWIFLLVGFDLFPRDVYYIERIPVRLAPVDLIFIIAPTVIASLVASVWPALRAARKDPVVALRYE